MIISVAEISRTTMRSIVGVGLDYCCPSILSSLTGSNCVDELAVKAAETSLVCLPSVVVLTVVTRMVISSISDDRRAAWLQMFLVKRLGLSNLAAGNDVLPPIGLKS